MHLLQRTSSALWETGEPAKAAPLWLLLLFERQRITYAGHATACGWRELITCSSDGALSSCLGSLGAYRRSVALSTTASLRTVTLDLHQSCLGQYVQPWRTYVVVSWRGDGAADVGDDVS